MEAQPPSPPAVRSPDKLDLKTPQSAVYHSSSIPSSDSVEEGEIVEDQFLALESPPPSQLEPKGRPQLFLSHAPSPARTPLPSESSTATVVSRTPSYASPNEPMTDEDLDHAKSLVLDLLGWGVTPEYLVECGVSRGAVHKIFTDLRLRLPNNLVPR